MFNSLIASDGAGFLGGLFGIVIVIIGAILTIMAIFMPLYVYNINSVLKRSEAYYKYLCDHAARQTTALETIATKMETVDPNIHDLKEYAKATYDETHAP